MLCLICARSGSKGLKNKNILKIQKKSLLQITIELAKKIKQVKKIVLSTDSKLIAKIGKKYGAIVPFLRPKNLSNDKTPEWKVWQHAIKMVQVFFNFNDVLILPVVSPLKNTEDIKKMLKMYKKNKNSCVIGVSESSHNPFFNMVTLDKKKNVKIAIQKQKEFFRRQDAPKVYDISTTGYILSKKNILEKKSIFECNLKAEIIAKERSIDIDTKLDFLIAKYLYERKIKL